MKTVIVIAGPTASGKSGLALELAAREDGVVINADSMQIYDGLPILTAQPSSADKQKSPHVLYSTLPPNDACSAVRWRGMALQEISRTDKTPIVVGGTGLYLRALIEGMSPIPEVPSEAREKAAALQAALGNPSFHAELVRRDPRAAGLDPYNTQRLIRAMEVFDHTGKSIVAWQELPREKPPGEFDFKIATLLPPRETLYKNCDRRFAEMLDAGALEEAAEFLQRIEKQEIVATAPLAKALGFPELAAFIAGKTDKETAIEAATLSTRHYAKRQTTWFRNQVKADVTLEKPDAGLVRF